MFEFLKTFVTHPFGSFALAVAGMFLFGLILDHIGRKQLEKEKEESSPEGMQRKLHEMEDERDELKSVVNDLDNQVKVIENELNDLKEENKELQQKSQESPAENTEKLKAENEALQKRIDEVISKNRDLGERVSGFSGQIDAIRNEQKGMSGDLDKRVKELEKENIFLRDDLENTPQEEDVLKLEEDRSRLSGQIFEYRDLCDDLEKQIRDYRGMDTISDESREHKEREIKIFAEEVESLTQELEQYKKMCNELEEKMGGYRSQDTISDESVAFKELMIKNLTDEKNQLDNEIRGYAETISKMNVAVEEMELLRDENHRLKKYIDITDEETSALQEKVEEAERQEDSQRFQAAEMNEMRGLVSKKDNRIEYLNEQIEHLEKQLTEASSKPPSADTEDVKRLEAAMRVLQDKNQALQQQIARVTSVVVEKDRMVDKMQKLSTELTDRLANLQKSMEPVLSDDDLLAEIREPDIPRVDLTPPKELFNVFLPKLITEDKKESAIPLLKEISGLTPDEARKLINRIVIPVIKGVDKEKAESIRKRFLTVGILARIKHQLR